MFWKIFATLTLTIILVAASPASAKDEKPSETSLQFAKMIAGACPNRWESPDCLKTLGESNFVLVANYGGTLLENQKKADAETLKENCAASTAAREVSVPAYAMASAMTECVNTIGDIAGKTGIKPDLSHFQMMGFPALCLSKDPVCNGFTMQLKALAR